MRRFFLLALPALCAAFTLAPVATRAADHPQQFRQRLSDIAPPTGTTDADVAAEIQFGREVAARILGRYPLSDNKALTRYVNLLGKGLALHADRPELPWHFAVIQSDQINAYSAPGGYVFITTAAIAQMHDEAELAGVLAHEIIHVNRRHIVRALDIHAKDGSVAGGLARFFGAAGDPARIAFTQALDKAMSILFKDGLDKADEEEADRLGTLLLAQVGYDPAGLERYLKQLEAVKDHAELAVVSHTHPPLPARVADITRLMREQNIAKLDYPTAQGRFDRYAR